MDKEKIIGSVITGFLMRLRCHFRVSIHKEKDGEKNLDCDISINSPPDYQNQSFLDKSCEKKNHSFLTFEKQ